MNRHQVILASAGLAIAVFLSIMGGINCFFYTVGLLFFFTGFGAMFVGRAWRLVAQYKQDKTAMDRAFLTIMAGFVSALAGCLIFYFVATFLQSE